MVVRLRILRRGDWWIWRNSSLPKEVRQVLTPKEWIERHGFGQRYSEQMSDLLRKNIRNRVNLTEGEIRRCIEFYVPKFVPKKHVLLHSGDVCRDISFVDRGCLRQYTVDERGEEHVVQFAMEDWWVSDLRSYLTGQPAAHTIEALEDSHLLMLERKARDEMLVAVPKMERFFRLLLEGHYVATQRRIEQSLRASAVERYSEFLRTFPTLAQRVSQKDIASYLGIRPQSLSRIRHNFARLKADRSLSPVPRVDRL
jgi:CRP-like cAMP-binding protein